jgi:hypothetical protein
MSPMKGLSGGIFAGNIPSFTIVALSSPDIPGYGLRRVISSTKNIPKDQTTKKQTE